MYLMLQYIMLVFGFIVAGICGLMPLETQFYIPEMFRYVFFMLGLVLSFTGVILVHMRAVKTGVHHFLAPGRPGNIIWLYVYKDGTIRPTPSVRVVEGQLYSKELDAQIHDFRSYKWFDTPVRIVPEGLGHACDLDMVLYTTVLKNKYHLSNIREAREKGFINLLRKSKTYHSQEMITTGAKLDEAYKEIHDYEREMKRKVQKGDVIGSS